ncbi:Macrolide export ATP-binding/permease protein MacB [compost metagenome]
MLKNYITIAFRNLFRHKAYSAINIAGLAIGIAACLLILQYVAFELSYDDFHVKNERIYRIKQDRYNKGQLSTEWAAGPFAVANSFKEAFPEIEDYVKLVRAEQQVVDKGGEPYKIEKVYYASGSFFKVFSFPLLAGDPKTVLAEPHSMAISETQAKALFGSANPIGKTLNLNNKEAFKITGVFKDIPNNSHLKTDVLLSYATFLTYFKDGSPETAWQWDGCLSYLLLRQGTDPLKLQSKFPSVVDKLAGAEHKQYNSSATYTLQPLKDIHLYSHYMMEAEANGDGKTVYLLLGIAFFIVVIAWVNYINLATARAVTRAKEVGIRKVVGSERKQLVFQFLLESALLNIMAVVIAILLMIAIIPLFNQLSGQHLTLTLFTKGYFWLTFISLLLLGILFSGIYPAFVLSGFKPIKVLKGKITSTAEGAFLRKSLVVFQFAISLFLLIGTFTVFNQIQYMRKQALGLTIDQTLVVNGPLVRNDSTFKNQMESFKQELLQNTSIKGVAASTTVPGQPVNWNAGGIRLIGQGEGEGKQYRVIGVDYGFMDVYGLKLIAGRTFSKDHGTDPKAVIFNKKAIEQLGFTKPQEAIGKQIEFWGETYTVVGVTENFHQQSLREAYEPLIIRLIPESRDYFSIRINSDQAASSITLVKAKWDRFFPGNTFEHFFLDQHFNDQYKADQRFGHVFTFFSLLAILVACLGLFGLASFTTIQRTKEIGIRKVLGASVIGILRLLYKEFAYLLIISFIISIPVAWYASNEWLQSYAFRVDIHWSYFAFPFIIVLLIALLTVSYQSLKAALSNPVNSLRTE